ncbi:MAG TPA: serine hydrolase domain-containing protein [Candidatus Limnocylindrales bacterium]|nr:serine hydrolase domain-containing protein [Candidatus Limnocylindrales bacterium]
MSGLYRNAKLLVSGVTAIFLLSVCIPFGQTKATKAEQEAKKAPDTAHTVADAAAPFTPHAPAHDLTGADVEAFLDGMMPSQIERENVAGAVIAVVKDGHVIFAKGYGYSDMEKRRPVTPDATLFRPGSISKLFTWTSVMQLVEQGKLDLDKDVSQYLDFPIPPAFGKPITLRDILTHTSGYEETARDLFVADAQHLFPLDQYLKNHMPERIFPPFVVPAYSNYATTLAGYIVQRVSGEPFAQYVAEHIYAPLDMKRTTFVQPLPAGLLPLMSNGYRKASGKAQPFEFVEAFPAGSVSTTAMDMCNFMIAHLQDGKFGEKQILRPETAKLMHSRLFDADDRLNGMAHGFYEESRNGHRIIGHGGDTELFHSDLHLILDSNVGFFVSYNSAGKGEVSSRTILFEKFLDRYFPYTPPPAGKIDDPKADAAAVAGLYKGSRRADSSFVHLLTLVGEAKVFPNADGTISVDALKLASGEPKKFEEIQPFLYREVHGQDLVGFKKDSSGNWQFQMDYPFFIFQRVGFLENRVFNYCLLIFGLVVVLLTVLLWPVGAMIRKHYGRPLELNPDERRQRLLTRLVCLLFLIVSIGWVVAISATDSITALNSLPPWIIIFGLLGVVCAFGTILVVLNAIRSWRTSGRWIWVKLHDVALALACLSLVWFLFTWNLLSFKTNF